MWLRATIRALAGWLLLAGAAQAQTLILIQGYLGSAGSWRFSGVAPVLGMDGWQDAGHLTLGPQGVMAAPTVSKHPQRFYTLDLPTEAPIGEQARFLSYYVAWVKAKHKGSPIVLVGHSAGGVAARMYMVTSREPAVRALVTIASPHLGSGLANVASAISNSPLSMMAPFFGADTINRSGGLYHDLGEEAPYNLVGWLNRQRHPPAYYVSVIRSSDGTPFTGDDVTEAWRQDMRMVRALQGQAQSYTSPGGHGLRPEDGRLISEIVRSFGLDG